MSELSAQNSQILHLLLDELSSNLKSFFEVLTQEKQAIRSSDLEALQQTLEAKTELSEQIEKSVQSSEQLLGAPLSEFFNDKSSLQLENRSDLEIVRKKLQTIAALTEDCHDLNLANGLSINTLSNINQFTLNLMSGKDPDSKTYGASGQTHPGKTTGRSIGKA